MLPGSAGCEMGGNGGVSADDPASAGVVLSSLSEGACVGTDDGSTGAPGGDCAPGTAGNENRLFTDGNEGDEENGADCSGPSDGITGPSGTEGTADAGRAEDGFGSLVNEPGRASLTPCVVGASGEIKGGSGLPGSETPGTRGNEYISRAAGIVGPALNGSVLDPSRGGTEIPGATMAAAAGEGCAAAISVPQARPEFQGMSTFQWTTETRAPPPNARLLFPQRLQTILANPAAERPGAMRVRSRLRAKRRLPGNPIHSGARTVPTKVTAERVGPDGKLGGVMNDNTSGAGPLFSQSLLH
jgi:hypothetical protein